MNATPSAVVISAGGSPGAYDIVRSMRLVGVRTIVASSDANDMAFSSRSCAGKAVLPSFAIEHDESMLSELRQLSRTVPDRPVLFYASDAELAFVSRRRDELSEIFRFLLPDEERLENLFNKVQFVEFARQHQLPVPAAVVCRRLEDLRAALPDISFPCIVKPAFSQDWAWNDRALEDYFGPYKQALRRFESPSSLMAFCERLPERPAGFLVQSYLNGRDEHIYSFHGYFDERSQCLGWFVGRKIRTYPPHTGGSCYVETTSNDALAELSIQSLQKIGFIGVVKIDFKWNEARGQYEILEINPRYNLWHVLGAYAGVNLPGIAFAHQTGTPIAGVRSSARHERLLYFKQDVRAFVHGYRASGEWGNISYVRSVLRPSRYRVFDPVDPVPALTSAVRFFARNGGRVLRRLLRRPAPNEEPRYEPAVAPAGPSHNIVIPVGETPPVGPRQTARQKLHAGRVSS